MEDVQKKESFLRDVKGLGQWLSVDVTIKIFGVTLWEYHFPPKND